MMRRIPLEIVDDLRSAAPEDRSAGAPYPEKGVPVRRDPAGVTRFLALLRRSLMAAAFGIAGWCGALRWTLYAGCAAGP